MRSLLDEFQVLLTEVDDWFVRSVRSVGAASVACRAGCDACCRGLFDISLIEALLLRRAWEGLPKDLRDQVRRKAELRLVELKQRWPNWKTPWLLNGLPDDEWTEMPEDDLTPCPLLGDDGCCLVYAARPMTCRLHGLPAIDFDGTDFTSAVCSRNRIAPEDSRLRYPFRDLFRREIELFRRFALQLTGRPYSELDTFIPTAILINFDAVDWSGTLLVDPREPG
ncbi:YkgJ family cysteine cluster protein [Geothermobacter hydrogeniphilus]|uniref:Zinc-or iron-chelating domain-containing protein n=1 Tax=Geothermobacter hydrogeniphilus TaxID=1969733 RepID=A0A1X0YCI5_9BACT|nr:YkgJ family cysteine cluster protein [Geothermobacter hydrogeniphilus]ORJ62940.1 hypothetical protein B5V00_02495 [Geothermobacter hydrogeniphilus]